MTRLLFRRAVRFDAVDRTLSKRVLSSATCVVVIASLGVPASGQTQDRHDAEGPPPVTLLGTHALTLEDSATGREFHITVNLPPGYEQNQRRYPVVYVTDGDSNFALSTAVSRNLLFDNEMPPVIMVGVGYGLRGIGPLWSQNRTRDLTPTTAELDSGAAGEAKEFSAFLRNDLLPHIDAHYRTDPTDRTLTGGSLAGLFTVYVMLHTPDTFHRYVARSPSLWWDDEITFEYEKAFARTHADLPVVLYTSMGSLESPERMFDPWQRFVRILQSRRYPGLHLVSEVQEDLKHSTAIMAGFAAGVRAAFAAVNVEPEILDRYVGTYQLGEHTLVVSRPKALPASSAVVRPVPLVLHVNEHPPIPFLARSASEFYLLLPPSVWEDVRIDPLVTFQATEAGPAQRLGVTRDGHPEVASRIP